MDSTYIKSIEAQNEELQVKLSLMENEVVQNDNFVKLAKALIEVSLEAILDRNERISAKDLDDVFVELSKVSKITRKQTNDLCDIISMIMDHENKKFATTKQPKLRSTPPRKTVGKRSSKPRKTKHVIRKRVRKTK
jgi:hypothetical protein